MSGGSPLGDAEKNFFEPRLGADFSGVKIHTDEHTAGMAEAINARAFTKGNDIAFAKGEYQPGSESGKRLMAHELTHVVQQGGGENLIQRQAETQQRFEKAKVGYKPNSDIDDFRILFEGDKAKLQNYYEQEFLFLIDFIPKEQFNTLVERYVNNHPTDILKFDGGFLVGIVIGVVLGVKNTFVALWDLVQLIIKLEVEYFKLLAE